MKKLRQSKTSSISKRIKELDVLFGNYIKLKHSNNGICYCCTCNKVLHLGTEDLQAGHYIKRQRWSIRWNEYNVNPQCIKCNYYLSGNESAYSNFIINRYGLDVYNKLHLATKVINKKPSIEEVEKLILYYEMKIKELK